ncbi:MAG: thioesterase family protein [Desulfitobacterium sp.]|nr:thioesterase family protein [Desulfitobacterium sp.]
MSNISIGLKGKAEKVVNENNTAKTMGSGSLDVFATPALVAMMEEAAVNALSLEEGQTSVGISINVQHTAATPLDMKVEAKAELIEIDGRKLTFKIEAFDEKGPIGSGVHQRFIVDEVKFMAKTNSKIDGQV